MRLRLKHGAGIGAGCRWVAKKRGKNPTQVEGIPSDLHDSVQANGLSSLRPTTASPAPTPKYARGQSVNPGPGAITRFASGSDLHLAQPASASVLNLMSVTQKLNGFALVVFVQT
jgi:hypothetical protein